MALIIFLIIIGIPVLELSVLIDVGADIGALPTVALCLLTAGVGLSLVRMQGLRVFQDMQVKTRTAEPVGANLIHGFFLLIAGIFLFIPGFITDFFGALLLFPFVRLMLGRAGMARIMTKANWNSGVRFTSTTYQSTPYNTAHDHDTDKNAADQGGGVTIDGEFTHSDQAESDTTLGPKAPRPASTSIKKGTEPD